MGLIGKVIVAAAAEAVERAADAERSAPPDPWRWAKRGIALLILALGWLFVLWAYRFHLTAPAVFGCIGFLALELAVYNLFRTGAQAAAEDGEFDDSTWGRPLGARAELEREKKALLKAIKEAEFDREMGKLSKADAEEMIGLYRARAIDVIKEIDHLGGSAGTVREQIEREVKARLELEGKSKHAAATATAKADKKKKGGKKTAAKESPVPKAEAAPPEEPAKAEDKDTEDESKEPASAEEAVPAQEPSETSSSKEARP